MADVLAIFGPTASGKSAVAEEVARLIPAELVSADAMQVYRGLPILTNQSDARLVGYLGLDEEGSVAEYQRRAHEGRGWVVLRTFGRGVDPAVHGAGVAAASCGEKILPVHEYGRAAGKVW